MSPLVSHLALSSGGLLLAGLAAALLRRVLRADPVLSYRTLVVVLISVLVLPVLQWLVQGKTAAYQEGVQQLVMGVVRAPPAAVPLTSPARSRSLPPATAARAVALERARPGPPAAAPIAASGWRGWCRAHLSALLASLYAAGALLALVRELARSRHTLRLLRLGQSVTDPQVLALWQELAASSPLRDRVRLLGVSGLDSPACFGLWRPVLLLPLPHGSRQSLEWAMRHELVHLERRDAHVALLQSLVTILFWFHPVAWWLAHEVAALRELSCDELVVAHSGQRRSYALALLDYAGERHRPAATRSIAPQLLHWSRSRSQLRRRIEMLARSNHVTGAVPRLMRRLTAAIPLSALWGVQLAAAATFLPSSSGVSAPIEDRTPKREALLQITTEKVGEDLAAQLDVAADQVLLVTDVAARGAAARAGLERFDVITHIDGRRPATRTRLHQATDRHAGDGSELLLRALRKGEAIDIAIALGSGGEDVVAPDLDARLRRLGYLSPKPGKQAAKQKREGRDFDQRGFEQQMEALGKELEESLGPALEQLGPELEQALEPSLRKLGTHLEQDLKPRLEQLGPELQAIIESHLEDLGPEIERALDPHLKALEVELEDLGPELEQLGPKLQAIIGPKLEQLGPTLQKKLKHLDQLAPSIEKMVREMLPAIQQELRENAVDQDQIEGAVKQALQALERAMKAYDQDQPGAGKGGAKAKPKVKAKGERAVRIM
ncbi:MAG: M56 family metallopeptidase [Planctomycetota bacterium]